MTVFAALLLLVGTLLRLEMRQRRWQRQHEIARKRHGRQ